MGRGLGESVQDTQMCFTHPLSRVVALMKDLHVTTNLYPPFTIITVTGELDAANQHLVREAVETPLTRPDVLLLFDLTHLDFIDSSGMDVILDCYSRLDQAGRVAVCGLSTHQQRLFDLMGITGRIPTYPTLEDALTYGAEP
ncbi:hypothetical protein GCM10009530_44270 [Microbispora corallina]|uniref:Anti-sigma factor antagonist n=2 Tax=Microbispora corallina TaxID=83302 RepID=A0ABQ4FX09_9ACTN|nr:hypothetical protein Mco01_23140 [Microbispora corallina]